MINVGKMRNRLQIQVPIRVRTAEGGFQVAWAILRTIYCQIQGVYDETNPHGQFRGKSTGHEMNFAGKTRSQISHIITCRYQSERLTTDMRLQETIKQQNNPNYRNFNITEALVLENIRNEMRIECKENLSDSDNELAIFVVVTESGVSCTDGSGNYWVQLI